MSVLYTFPMLWGELWLYSVVWRKGTSYLQQEQTVIGKNMCFTVAVWVFYMTDNKSTQSKLHSSIQNATYQAAKSRFSFFCRWSMSLMWHHIKLYRQSVTCSEAMLWAESCDVLGPFCWKTDSKANTASLKSSSKAACRATGGFRHLTDCSSPWDALWGWPSDPMMGCGAFCPKGRRLDWLSYFSSLFLWYFRSIVFWPCILRMVVIFVLW